MLMSQLVAGMGSEGRRKISESRLGRWLACNGAHTDANPQDDPAIIVAEAYAGLPPYAVAVADAMLLSFGPTPREEECLVAELKQQARLSGSEARSGLARLGEAGMAFAIRRAWGEQWWVLPSDLYAILMNLAFPSGLENERWPETEVLPLMDGGGQFLAAPLPFERTFMYGLSIIARSDAALTAKGILPKKTVDKLSVLFHSIEAPLEPFALRKNQGGQYPLGVAVFLEAANALGLLEVRERRCAVLEQPLDVWLRNPNRDRLLQDWLTSRLTEIAGPYSSSCADILSLRGREGGDCWRSECELAQIEERRLGKRQTGGKTADWQRQSRWAGIWLELFYAFGWLELGHPAKATGGERLYRWKSRVEEGGSELIIQPSGELIAGPGCEFACRWELELIAERKLDGELTQYAISPRTISAALELGRTKKTICDFLLASSRLELLPPSLEAILEQWTDSVGQFQFVQATLLRCGSPERADWLARQPEARPLLVQRLGLTDFVVEGDQVSKLRKLLQQAGYPPRKGVSASFGRDNNANEMAYPAFRSNASDSTSIGANYTEERDTYRVAAEGVYVADPVSLRQCPVVDHPWPERLLASDWQSVPHMWSNQLREYHLSTRKELLQKAIALETAVKLRADGKLRAFIPERLEQRDGEWSVIGVWQERDASDEARLSPEMWDEMGIAMPEGLLL